MYTDIQYVTKIDYNYYKNEKNFCNNTNLDKQRARGWFFGIITKNYKKSEKVPTPYLTTTNYNLTQDCLILKNLPMQLNKKLIFNIEFQEGKTIDMFFKNGSEIIHSALNKIVILMFENKDEFVGELCSVDEGMIVLKSLDKESLIGLPVNRLNHFLEEV